MQRNKKEIKNNKEDLTKILKNIKNIRGDILARFTAAKCQAELRFKQYSLKTTKIGKLSCNSDEKNPKP